jgi:hypothetical protein
METFVDVVVEHVSRIKIVCNIDQIGDWIKILKQKDFMLDAAKQVSTHAEYREEIIWELKASRSWSMDERWEGVEIG